MLNRRRFLGPLSVSLFTPPLGVEAQPTGKVSRMGLRSPTSPSDADRNPRDLAVVFAAFQEGLRELGYVGGQNLERRRIA